MARFTIFIKNPTFAAELHISKDHDSWTLADFRARPRPDSPDDPAGLATLKQRLEAGGKIGYYKPDHALTLEFGINQFFKLSGFFWDRDGVQEGSGRAEYGSGIALPTAIDWTATSSED